ncbi:MAG: heavy metal-binding domain-containing protein [Bdellovibrionaceae bacterium]|nr:heavy metal-binding domain-containing protein [Pseudobdellovibrionaceae bacterium]
MFEIVTFLGLVIVGYTVGSRREATHLKELAIREQDLLYMSVRADKAVESSMVNGQLVTASVIIANDYFKVVATSLKSFVGGQIRSQETLLDRARREATLRLKAKAKAMGASEIIGYRLDTSMVDSAGVEIFVYGTAITHSHVHT